MLRLNAKTPASPLQHIWNLISNKLSTILSCCFDLQSD